ncbi:hypothetical protein WKR88_18990 [Trinickia caryophylli]|uniref:Beta-barrel assembly machine subunit BamE n=1 Tax=Trinickia caryophylli TaxID=28094 RepID=A0A1X7DG74_TRICW|nr:hypothetical protein [Trinickia caryophylli]TRX16946.1 hypothetical protein FNF07_00995 [Trinickia caryophylli]WQE12321.1 hypothetical protein U0034_02550 [Trinickia caryophylli]GLU31533.1 hypothetical protein Busp01_13750 [Trinickia caryophylli]SMF15126.1 hypothetical protein SAMN06295900_103162 [Trinickia caryophylli]
MFKIITIIALCFMAVGCNTMSDSAMGSAPVGTAFGRDKYSLANLKANLVVGKTKQADVKRIYGEPQRTDTYMEDPNGRWVYSNDTSRGAFSLLLNHLPSMGGAGNAVAGHEPEYGAIIDFKNGVVASFRPVCPNGKC